MSMASHAGHLVLLCVVIGSACVGALDSWETEVDAEIARLQHYKLTRRQEAASGTQPPPPRDPPSFGPQWHGAVSANLTQVGYDAGLVRSAHSRPDGAAQVWRLAWRACVSACWLRTTTQPWLCCTFHPYVFTAHASRRRTHSYPHPPTPSLSAARARTHTPPPYDIVVPHVFPGAVCLHSVLLDANISTSFATTALASLSGPSLACICTHR